MFSTQFKHEVGIMIFLPQILLFSDCFFHPTLLFSLLGLIKNPFEP